MTRNITLNADDRIIEEARKRAREEHKSLNTVFRDWLFRYARCRKRGGRYAGIMHTLAYADPGHRFTRSEMNER